MTIPVRWLVCGLACLIGFCVAITTVETPLKLGIVAVCGMVAVATADRP
jgi:hypothetical protein